MKKENYIYPILFLLAMLLPLGCADAEMEQSQQAGDDAEKVYLRIGVTLPEAQAVGTRAFNNNNFEFEDLHVAVFVPQGNTYILEEFVQAELKEPAWNNQKQHWEFEVELSKTDGGRRLHFIANYPGLTMGLGEEGSLIGRLLANASIDNGQHDVYWNYMDVECIDEVIQQDLQKIPLVRNFAKIVLQHAPKDGVELNEKFRILGYAMHNVPKRGTVAPYNSTNGSFANYVVRDGQGNLSCQSYNHLEKQQGYVGNEPYGNELINLTDFYPVTTNDDGTISADPFYMFERTHVNVDNPTCIIIRGKYAAGGNFDEVQETYYKLDFIHRDAVTNTNVYYNMLRNFVYTMKIVDVTGEGYATPQDAINNPASNNISGNAKIDDFTNISDGTGRLFVSTTYLVFTDEEPVDIYYQYIPDIATPAIKNNNLKTPGGSGEIVVNANEGNVLATAARIATADETTGHVGWRKITLTPKAPPANEDYYVYTQDITVATNHLQRKVTLVMRNPYDMTVYAYDPNDNDKRVAKGMKQAVDVKVTIPSSMPQALFPLKFYVTSGMNSIYAKPGGDMYSESFSGGYGFVKEISWEFYNNANANGLNGTEPVGKIESDGRISFVCNFWTNCEENATDVFVYNEYFNRGQDGFDNEWKTSVAIGTSIAVDVQKNNGRYPQTIYNNGNNNGTKNVSFTYNGRNYSLTIDRDNVTSGVTLENNAGIDPSTVLTFTFTDKYYAGNNSWVDATYTATCTVRQLINGTTLTFTAPTPADVVWTTDASIGVQIQRSNWRYPQTIYDNGSNNGTVENVIVKMNGVQVGTVTIDKNNVSGGFELYNSKGFSGNDLLTFTFEDQYWTSSRTWSSAPVTYMAECTVNELQVGTTLEFTAADAEATPETLVITGDNFAGVTVEQEKLSYKNGRYNYEVDVYPRNIHNGSGGYYTNPTNEGTETVTVYYKDSPIGEITITKDSVVNGSITIAADDVVLEENLVFTFNDYYCSGVEYKNNTIRYTFNNRPTSYSSGNITLGDLVNGDVTLNFTHP